MTDTLRIAGLPAGLVIIVDAAVAPVHFLHEDAEVPAANRFHLPDDQDFTLAIGNRAVIGYDVDLARNTIVLVGPIPAIV